MLVEFKSIASTKNGYVVNFKVEETLGDAIVKAKVSINLNDAEIPLSSSLDETIEKAQAMAVREYSRRQ